jgi:hypothetical protein
MNPYWWVDLALGTYGRKDWEKHLIRGYRSESRRLPTGLGLYSSSSPPRLRANSRM